MEREGERGGEGECVCVSVCVSVCVCVCVSVCVAVWRCAAFYTHLTLPTNREGEFSVVPLTFNNNHTVSMLALSR